ncbi:restriction endonuclease subunit S [Bacteroides fragilis]|uniref:restriction endonuclease subunit S n=1 Tax=Bacteroides fragilis TaxID=817 RepID=UPI000446FD2E|nr:restriction endonuclease subunit S [Bacteroides fragilis]EXZ01630.1 type I restriction modification DNA specificity domain protein [Bacteroides fragilis str. DS-166]MCA5607966.1 restriction endonuclease subunit S [Bacteroides fragilis]UVR71839.1 restriction endonuclease subunit S [Bacteroides fragilis]
MGNVPNLRFPEFCGEWETIKVSELLDFYSTNSLSWEQLDYSNGKIKNLHYGLIHKGVPTMVDVACDSLPYIKEESMLKSFTLFKEGDVAFADASEDTNDVAKAIEVVNCDNQQIVSGLHTIHGRDNSNRTVIGYKGYAFASDSFHKQIRRIAQGTKVFSISVRNFDEAYIGIPSKEEQTQIAKLLITIDKRIATQNKIIEDLKKLKSAISLNVLHSDKWEQFKIKDIAQIGRGRVISSIEIGQQKSPTYPVYSSQTSNDGIMGYLDDYMFEGEYISWTTDGANAGTVFYRNGKFNCTNVCGLLKLRKEFDTHFVSLVLAEATKKYVSINLANPKLMNNTMGNIQIRLPKLEEQKRISIVFRVLQRLWTVHNSLLTEYTKQEQYLLSQMFI